MNGMAGYLPVKYALSAVLIIFNPWFKNEIVLRKIGLICLVLDQQAKDPDHRFIKVRLFIKIAYHDHTGGRTW